MVRRKRLVFREAYREKIALGAKVATIRLNSSLRVGDFVDVVAGRSYVGSAVITSVEVKKVSQLTDRDAELDGFRSREELLRELRRIYGRSITDSTEVKVIRFKLLGR
ncbi:MAG: ASCH domain-containing protein [Sulfolobales archaeon]|nr:ASCH domain-containing protein [Sulfolobales archaeon]MDW8010188.1 ASCH domain-containing protein [Sulfolobales archaeon]